MAIKKNVNISRICSILARHIKNYKLPLAESQEKDPYKILVSTILSARTKDVTTEKACERLFKLAPDLKSLSKLSVKQIEKLIFPVGFYKNKALFLKQLPITITKVFQGEIPQTIEGLIKLPGVGRKTANLVMAVAFNKHAICVDVHVHRIMNRLGYVKTKTPFETEFALRKQLPKKYWKKINHYLVAFGQNLCYPVSPFCSKCPIYNYCERIGVKKSR